MNRNFSQFASASFKRVVESPAVKALVSSTSSFLSQNKTQVVITAGLLAALALMNNKTPSSDKEKDEQKLEDIDESDTDGNIPRRLHSGNHSLRQIKQDDTTQKVAIGKPNVTEDLVQDNLFYIIRQKKSWRHLNKRINRSMKIKGITTGGFKLDQTFDETSEDGHIRSPDYSIVSDLDQKFYADHFKNTNKLRAKKGYQTDNDSDNCLTFLKQKKLQMLKLSQDQRQGSDTVFFKLYAQVAEHEIEDEDD